MIPDKLRKLIELLTQKTLNKKAIWNRGSGDNQFKLSVGAGVSLTVTQWFDSYKDEVGYQIVVFNDNGQAIERYDTSDETNKEDFELLRIFHKAANDQYYKVEETMETLLNLIISEDVIGNTEEAEPEDDGLPF